MLAGGLGFLSKEDPNSMPTPAQKPLPQNDAQGGLEASLRRQALAAAKAKPSATTKQALNGRQPGAVVQLNGAASDHRRRSTDADGRKNPDKAQQSSQHLQKEAIQSRGNAPRPNVSGGIPPRDTAPAQLLAGDKESPLGDDISNDRGVARTASQHKRPSQDRKAQEAKQLQARVFDTAAAQDAIAKESFAEAPGHTDQQRAENGAASTEPEQEPNNLESLNSPGVDSVSSS